MERKDTARTNRYDQVLSVCDKLIETRPCAENYLLKSRFRLEAGKIRQSIGAYLLPGFQVRI